MNENVDYPVVIVPISGKGDILGQKFSDKIQSVMGTTQKGRITKRKNDSGTDWYGVIRGAVSVGTVGMIIEHSFHTNTRMTQWLLVDANLEKLAEAEAQVIAQHFGLKKKSAGLQAADLKDLTEAQVVAKVGSLFTDDQKQSGILASVSMAQFILESGYGHTELAQNANNCFGMKKSLSGNTWKGSVWDGQSIYTKKTQEWDGSKYITITADFRKYPCVEKSIADHSAYLLDAMIGSKKRYEGLKGCLDYKKAIQIIKDGGYATSPDYVTKICNIIEKWNLTDYDIENATTPTTPADNSNYPAVPFTVKVIIDDLNYRSEPSMNGKVNGQTGKGIFTITKVSNGWGKLKSGAGWIWLGNPSYCTIQGSTTQATPSFSPYTVRVNIPDLNIRSGAGTNYKSNGYTGKGVFTIVAESDGQGASKWGKLKSGAGWISLDFVTKV